MFIRIDQSHQSLTYWQFMNSQWKQLNNDLKRGCLDPTPEYAFYRQDGCAMQRHSMYSPAERGWFSMHPPTVPDLFMRRGGGSGLVSGARIKINYAIWLVGATK